MLLRGFLALLVALLLGLQYRIWFGPADAFDALALRDEIAEAKLENERLSERNRALAAEVSDLKQGGDAVEERARADLGMVKQDETFYRVVAPAAGAPAPASAPGTAPAPQPAPTATDAADRKPATSPPRPRR